MSLLGKWPLKCLGVFGPVLLKARPVNHEYDIRCVSAMQAYGCLDLGVDGVLGLVPRSCFKKHVKDWGLVLLIHRVWLS